MHNATDVALDSGPHHIVDPDNVDPKRLGRLLAHDSAVDNGIHAVRRPHHLFRVGDIDDLYLMGRLEYPWRRRTRHLRYIPVASEGDRTAGDPGRVRLLKFDANRVLIDFLHAL